METKEPLRLPAFEKVIGFAVQKALEDWRDEALEGGNTSHLCPVGLRMLHRPQISKSIWFSRQMCMSSFTFCTRNVIGTKACALLEQTHMSTSFGLAGCFAAGRVCITCNKFLVL